MINRWWLYHNELYLYPLLSLFIKGPDPVIVSFIWPWASL